MALSMVEKIDRLLAIEILNKCFRGLKYDASLRRHFVHIPNVSRHTLKSLKDIAASRGIKLRGVDLNSFLANIADMELCTKTNYEFSLAENEVLTGEVVRLYLNNMETYVEIIKANVQDYIVVRLKGYNLPKVRHLHVKPDFQWQIGKVLSFGDNNNQIIKDIVFLTPRIEHRYIDWWLEPSMAEYKVEDNLWPLYNKTYEIMDDNSMNNCFSSIARDYLHQGLSVFSLYKIIHSIEYFWYGADV